MSNYLYFLHEEQPLTNRFDGQNIFREGYPVNGVDDWRRLISLLLNFLQDERSERNDETHITRRAILSELIEISGNNNFSIYDQQSLIPENRTTEELIVILLLTRLRKLYGPLPKNNCPRLFVSHRKADKDCALRIAEIAAQNGFAYWVDVLDPDLQTLSSRTIPENLVPLLTACIIEMALINCTHVIACMTPNSRGTLWIPYEYGRITEVPGLSVNACAWLHPNLQPTDFAEYLLLGALSKKEMEIEYWLKNEWKMRGRSDCMPDMDNLSSFGKIAKLPEVSDDEVEKQKIEFENWLEQGMPLRKKLTVSNVPLKFKRKERP